MPSHSRAGPAGQVGSAVRLGLRCRWNRVGQSPDQLVVRREQQVVRRVHTLPRRGWSRPSLNRERLGCRRWGCAREVPCPGSSGLGPLWADSPAHRASSRSGPAAADLAPVGPALAGPATVGPADAGLALAGRVGSNPAVGIPAGSSRRDPTPGSRHGVSHGRLHHSLNRQIRQHRSPRLRPLRHHRRQHLQHQKRQLRHSLTHCLHRRRLQASAPCPSGMPGSRPRLRVRIPAAVRVRIRCRRGHRGSSGRSACVRASGRGRPR